MHKSIRLLKNLDDLDDPVLVSGFRVRRKAGRSAVSTLVFLCKAWQAELVAKINTEQFFDLTVYRPQTRYSSDDRIVDWPEPAFYRARPPGASRDVLLLVANEPNFYWRAFADAITDFSGSIGVKTLVTMRALPGYVPHTRACPVSLVASDDQMAKQFGLRPEQASYTGEIDIGGLLSIEGSDRGWRTADLTTLQPFYFPRMPCSSAALVFIGALDRLLGSNTEVASLIQKCLEEEHSITQAYEGDSDMRATITKLEETFDADIEYRWPPGEEGETPSNQKVIEEIEKFLHEHREQT